MTIILVMEEWDVIVNSIAEIITNAENVQRKLGKEASKVVDQYGVKALKDLSENIKENSGVTRSANTLRNYAWVYTKTKELELPEDISFSVCQLIAGQPNPREWADKITEGMSGPEVARLIRGTRPKKKIKCPICGGVYEKS